MELVLLGTSAAVPTPRRWPSATALIREGEILLFDCGEGAQIRFQKAQLRPGRLSKVFISHFHGDHFYGLIGLLTSLQLLGRDKPLFLFSPAGLEEYLEFMQKLSGFRFQYDVLIDEFDADSMEKVWDLGDYQVTARPLEHSIFSLGFRVEEKPKPGKFLLEEARKLGVPSGPLRNKLQSGETVRLADGKQIKPSQVLGPKRPGKTVAICLDSRPCENALWLARDADVLIHDGTFDESRRDLADATRHSTVKQAAEIAKKAGVKKLVLSHISQRYRENDETLLVEQAREIFENAVLAQDLERIPV